MFDRKCVIDSKTASPWMAGIVAFTLLLAASGCKKNQDAAQTSDPNGPDPAAANQASVDPNQPQSYAAAPRAAYGAQSTAPRTRVLGQSQQAQPYQQSEQPAPIERAPDPQNYTPPQQDANNQAYQPGDENYDTTIDQYAESAPQPPPPLPVYEQPPAPEPNYLWTPGYWNYAPTGYFWVPGAWCAPPYDGALWTPGYWGYGDNRYRFHRGFWGLHIGFYGGIPYGFGYTGHGYEGGYWRGNQFYYNRAVNRVNETVIHNTYVHNVTIDRTVVNNRISYNGPGGQQARPAAYEVAAMRERHTPPMAAQTQIRQQAAGDRQQFFNQNHGQPAVAVAQRPLVADRGVAAPSRQPFAQTVQPGVSGQRPVQQQTPGGLGQRNGANEPQSQQQRFAEQQQRNAPQQEQQRNQQAQQQQQRGQQELQQKNQQAGAAQQEQQRNQQQQQHNQQQEQQRNQQLQEQQRNQQQQHNQQQEQQHKQQLQQQQQRTQQQQQVQQQQRTQQPQQEQQRVQQQQRSPQVQQQQQRAQPEPQRQQQPAPQRAPQPQAQPRVEAPRQQPQAQPRSEPQRAAPEAHPAPEARPSEGRPH